MPAPQSSAIKGAIQGKLSSDFKGTPEMDQFLTAVADGVSSAWATWASGLTGAKATVSGVGIAGPWTGTGTGGKLTEGSPFETSVTPPFEKTTEPMQKLLDAIKSVLKDKFSTYASSYGFGPLNYAGTSTALPPAPPGLPAGAPGSFTANLIPITLGAGKLTATTPSSIASEIQGLLGPPFDFGSGASKLPDLLAALEGGIRDQFTIWETAALFSGDMVNGASAPPLGTGSGTSTGTGKVA